MPSATPRLPKLRHFRPRNLAVVRLDGKDHYLGKFGSVESRAEYDRLIAEWLANGRRPTASPNAAPGATIDELLLAFWQHAEAHYRKPDGRPTGELENFRHALKPLRKLYGRTPAMEFGPLALRAVRGAMVDSGLARTTTNARVNQIRRVFKWACSMELVCPSVLQGLQAVAGLQEGRTEAPEPRGIGPVAVEHVEAALPFMTRPVAAMVRLQLLTGCRVGEIVAMRGCDLTLGVPCGEYRPADHKNTWRGRGRVIPLGPKSQAIVRDFLKPDLSAYLFSPRDAVGDYHAALQSARKREPYPCEIDRRSRSDPRARYAAGYNRNTYRFAVVRACRRAGVPEWSPLQLRHTAATAIRARYGLEASQVILGHAKADVTQIYAERDQGKAHTIMAEIG